MADCLHLYGPCHNCGDCIVKFKVVDWCDDDSVVTNVDLKIYEVVDGDPGDLLVTTNTGASGVYTSDLPPADYLVEPTKDGYHGYNPIRSYSCGTNLIKLTDWSGHQFLIFGCPDDGGDTGGPLADARIVISGPRAYELQTDATGQVYWYPEESGTYHFLITHPSGRFEDFEVDETVSVCSTPISFSYRLEPKEDYTCCYSDFGKSFVDHIPRGKILVTTSAGDSWEFVGCEEIYCSFTEEVLAGGPPKSVNIPGIGGGCTYSDFPDDLGMTTIPCKVHIIRSYSVDSGWVAELATPHDGLTWSYSVARRDPMTLAGCRNQPGGSTHWISKKWYRTGDCPNPGIDSDWTWLSTGELDSADPLSVTFTFENTAPESYGEEWDGAAEDAPVYYIPPPIRTITITEVV